MTIYRKIYEENYGPIPKDKNGRTFEIHHIDGDRENNNLDNLLCVSIEEHYNIHFEQRDYNACLLILQRMCLTPEEISQKAREIAFEQLEKGIHNFSKPEFQKRNAIRRVEDGSHHWLGQKNPSHKRIKEGTHNFQTAEKKKCEHCNEEIDIGNYALYHGDYCYKHTGLKSPGAAKLDSIAGKSVKNTIWITDGNTNKRIGKNSIIPTNWKRGKTMHNLDGLRKGAEKRKGVALKRVQCPHCNKEGGISQMKQWHFDKCKQKGIDCE